MAWALGHHLVAWPVGVTGLGTAPRQEMSPKDYCRWTRCSKHSSFTD